MGKAEVGPLHTVEIHIPHVKFQTSNPQSSNFIAGILNSLAGLWVYLSLIASHLKETGE
jgi:hypothetical protein